MITNIAAPVLTAITAFAAALVNVLVVLGAWHLTAEGVASVNALILSGVGIVASLRAGAQQGGTLTATPNGHGDPAP